MNKSLKTIKDTTIKFFSRLGFPEIDVDVSLDQQERILIQANVNPQDSGLLIGFHGETIYALQLILGQILAKKLGEWKPIVVNIGDYREKRQEALQSMAINAAQRVREANQSLALPYLNGNERRIIHLALAEDSNVETISQGEGRKRRLIIRPKQAEQAKHIEEEALEEKVDEEKE